MACPRQYESDFARTERGSRNADEQHLQVMIHAYIDDSGDERKHEYAVCGGILGEALTMTFTEALWVAETKHLDKPFRSTECECQQGQFKKWDKPDCDQLMERLVSVLSREGMKVGLVGTAVPIQLFRKIFPDSDQDDPMRLAIRHVMVTLVKLSRRQNERTKLWFENGPTDADVLRAYNEVKVYQFPNALERDRFAGLSFADKTLAPLQAADLAARECFKAAKNRGQRPTRKPMKRMWGHSGMLEFDESCLLKLKEVGGPLSIEAINGMGTRCHMQIVTMTPYSQTVAPV